MVEPLISVKGISKKYRIGLADKKSDTMMAAIIKGIKNPLTNLNRIRNLSKLNDEDDSIFWALKDVSFDVQEGEVLGIIGHNGAGKSTLLKLLSQITEPSGGEIRIYGRVAALLEVGTGFHPELTGRENIYMNGTILGMRKKEIDKKLDEIVNFSGVEKHLDTPVKFYSSGMRVRLGFSVAAHLEPEILIIDEVLSVGDAEFQKKCLGKMNDVSKQGRTVLFVSHNLGAVKQLCNRGIVLDKGKVAYEGSAIEAVNFYQSNTDAYTHLKHIGRIEDAPGNDRVRILFFEVRPALGEIISVSSGLIFELTFFNARPNINLAATFELRTADEIVVFHHGAWLCQNLDSKRGVYSISGKIDASLLNSGIYKFDLILAASLSEVLYSKSDIVQFEIANEVLEGNSKVLPGIIRPAINYNVSFRGEDFMFDSIG
jgi:lipopolysaccharide transport system ATP-binding protein